MMPLLLSLTEAHPNGNSHSIMYTACPNLKSTPNHHLFNLGGVFGFPAQSHSTHAQCPVKPEMKIQNTPVDSPKI
jgi:hypothetical protein